jgi:hypothetical protein
LDRRAHRENHLLPTELAFSKHFALPLPLEVTKARKKKYSREHRRGLSVGQSHPEAQWVPEIRITQWLERAKNGPQRKSLITNRTGLQQTFCTPPSHSRSPRPEKKNCRTVSPRSPMGARDQDYSVARESKESLASKDLRSTFFCGPSLPRVDLSRTCFRLP